MIGDIIGSSNEIQGINIHRLDDNLNFYHLNFLNHSKITIIKIFFFKYENLLRVN